MKTSSEYRGIARESLKNNWGIAILVMLFLAAIDGVLAATYVGSIFVFIITGPLTVGVITFFKKLIDKQKVGFETVFNNITEDFSSKLTTYLLQQLYIFLWSLLFIIPGIIKSYSYALTMYIKSRNKNISNNEAIKLSMQLMNGKKYKLFCLHLSFIGWFILSILTFGIGFIFLAPYFEASVVAFYSDAYSDYEIENPQKENVEVIEETSQKENGEDNAEENKEIVIEE